jgi:hypothetical protein
MLHFGLGNATRIDSLTIDWPCSRRQSFTSSKRTSSTRLPSLRTAAAFSSPPPKPGKLRTPLFHATNLLDNISIVEPAFDDSAREPLLPWRLSQRAGCTAWGDVNGDGKTDLFIGGMPGQPAQLFIRNAAGRFEASAQPAFEADKDCEDAAAVFFDANHNGQQNLLVVGGGVRHELGDASYRHRLYINDGKGHFSPALKDALPSVADGAMLCGCGGL